MSNQRPARSRTSDRETWYLFSYDITEPKRARRALRCLSPWRSGGQLSVHELRVPARTMEELVVELLNVLDRSEDRLLVCRYREGRGCWMWGATGRRDLLPWPASPGQRNMEFAPGAGLHLLAYDVREPKRLRAVQRLTARACLALQRSVYLFDGSGSDLSELLRAIQGRMKRTEDNLRLYRLSGKSDIWFPSGPLPAMPGVGEFKAKRRARNSLWGNLFAIFKKGLSKWET